MPLPLVLFKYQIRQPPISVTHVGKTNKKDDLISIVTIGYDGDKHRNVLDISASVKQTLNHLFPKFKIIYNLAGDRQLER